MTIYSGFSYVCPWQRLSSSSRPGKYLNPAIRSHQMFSHDLWLVLMHCCSCLLLADYLPTTCLFLLTTPTTFGTPWKGTLYLPTLWDTVNGWHWIFVPSFPRLPPIHFCHHHHSYDHHHHHRHHHRHQVAERSPMIQLNLNPINNTPKSKHAIAAQQHKLATQIPPVAVQTPGSRVEQPWAVCPSPRTECAAKCDDA